MTAEPRCITCVGSPAYKIVVGTEEYEFEMHYLGPMPVTKRGAARTLGNCHPFWKAVSYWASQGREVDDSGLCVWRVPPGPKLQHLGGRHYLIVGEGDD